jgi:protein O-GlcNAc transferase
MLAYLKRGDTYRRTGELTAAVRDLGEAAALAPNAPQPMELLGDVNAALGRHDRAIEHYRRYLQIDDRAPRVFYKLGLAIYRAGDAGRALEPLLQAISLDNRLVEAHYLLGMAYRSGGRSSDALGALSQAVSLNPAFVVAREELAAMYVSLGRRREAIEQLEAIAALEPGVPERLVNVALAYAEGGRVESAVQTLARAAERYPDDARVYQALGRVWLDAAAGGSGDASALDKAISALERIADRGDATSEALTLYGRALLMSQQTAAAERVLQRATSRIPMDASALPYLADAAQRLGHAALADAARVQLAALTGR